MDGASLPGERVAPCVRGSEQGRAGAERGSKSEHALEPLGTLRAGRMNQSKETSKEKEEGQEVRAITSLYFSGTSFSTIVSPFCPSKKTARRRTMSTTPCDYGSVRVSTRRRERTPTKHVAI